MSRYRSLILDLSQELGLEDSKGLAFLAGVPSPVGGCCRGCCARGGGVLELLQKMQERRVFGEYNLEPLVDLLKEIGRVDLASKCEEFCPPPPPPPGMQSATVCVASSPPKSPLCSSWNDSGSPAATPTMELPRPVQRHNKLCDLTKRVTQRFRRLRRCSASSCGEGLDSFHIVDGRDLAGFEGSDGEHGQLVSSHSLDSPLPPTRRNRSFTTLSVDSGLPSADSSLSSTFSSPPLCDRTPYQSGRPTCVWPLKRSEFINPIFNHDNRIIEKRFKMRAGSRENGCGLTFLFKLYPNGVNWDQDTAASLQVAVITSSGPGVSSNLYFGVQVTERQGPGDEIIHVARRKVCRLHKEREFLITQFLPHEVVKTSTAKVFHILFHVELSYLLGEDWVCIDSQQAFGCILDPAPNPTPNPTTL